MSDQDAHRDDAAKKEPHINEARVSSATWILHYLAEHEARFHVVTTLTPSSLMNLAMRFDKQASK